MTRRALALCLFVAFAAGAHQQSLSYGELRVHDATIDARLRLSLADLAAVAVVTPRAPPEELARAAPAIARATLGELRIRVDAGACTLGATQVLPDQEDGAAVTGQFDCPGPADSLDVRVGMLELLPPGHTHLVKITFADDDFTERALQAGAETFTAARHQPLGRAVVRFLRLGVEHIFTGIDHIAFLLALLVLGGAPSTLVKIVTAFTVAHSITLAVATLGLLSPPSRVIEPLIAASIVYVAAENLWALRRGGEARALSHRWMLTFAFGLVHGFGFADALRELHLPRASLATALVTFNLGVEAGQLCILLAALPLFALVRRTRFGRTFELGLSVLVGLAGVVWMTQRLAGH